MRTVNTRFFCFLLGSIVVIAGGMFGVHRLQAGNITRALLWQAEQAEQNGKANVAARYLGQYLEFVPNDIEQRAHLAHVLSDENVTRTPAAQRRAEYVINQVLAWDPQRNELRRRLCRILLASRRLDALEEHVAYLQTHQPESAEVALLIGQWKETQLQARGTSAGKGEQEKLFGQIRQAYEKAIKADPKQVDAYLRLVGILRLQDFGKDTPKNASDVDRVIEQALANVPGDAAVLGLAAQRAQEKGDSAAALKYLEEGLKQHANEPRLFLALARLYSQRGERAQAIAQLRKGLAATGKDYHPDLSWMLANLLIDAEDIDAARKIVAQTRGLNALSADYLDARCLMHQGRWYDAARLLDKLRPAFKVVPELAVQVDLFLGLCHQKLDEPLLALGDFGRAAKADPTSLLARHGEAMALAALGRRDEALDRFKGLIDGKVSRADTARWRLQYARMLLAGNLAADPQVGVKVRAVLAETEKNPKQAVECALLRSAMLFAEQKPQEAQAELHRIIKADPKRYEPWLALAELALESQQPEQAITILKTADSSVADAIDYRLAQVPFWSRFFKDKTEVLDRLERDLGRFTAKEQARLLEALADAHYRAGRLPAAARLLGQMAALPPHAEDVRVRMLLLGLAIAQDDEPAMQRVLAEIKRIEGETATEWSYGAARHLIWRAQRKAGDVKEQLTQARALLITAGQRRRDWPALFVARGEIDELEGKSEQAIASYRRAIDLGSRDPHCVYQLMQLLTQAQRFEEAEQLVRKMDQVGLGTPIAHRIVLGLLLKEDGHKVMQMAPRVFRADSRNFRDHLLHGQVLSAGGRFSPEAEAAFRRAVVLGSRHPETWIALVRYLGSTGQYAKAVEEIQNAAKKLDDDVKLLSIASCYEALGALDEAEARFRKALAAEPRSARLLRATADFLLRFNKPRDAEPLFRAVLASNPSENDAGAARRGLALALARGGNPKNVPEALKLVGLTMDENGAFDERSVATSSEERLVQARVLSALASHNLRRQAIKLFDAMHQQQSLALEDQFQFAYLLHIDGSNAATWRTARAIFSDIVKAQPNDARYLAAFANLLIVHRELADSEPLIARLEQLERDRKLPLGLLGSVELKARFLELRGRGDEAIALLKDYVGQKDAVSSRRLLLAGLHGRLGHFQDVVDLCLERRDASQREEAFGAAIGILRAGRPASEKTRHERWQPQLARLETSLRESIAADAKNVMLRMQLADLLDLRGQAEASAATCREILKLDPDNLVALNNLAWSLAQQQGKAQDALELIDRAIAGHGPRAELLDTRAVVYLGLGRAQEAIRDLEQAVRESPSPTRYFHLTRAHHLAKNAPQALAALQRADELGLNAQSLAPADRQAYDVLVRELREQ